MLASFKLQGRLFVIIRYAFFPLFLIEAALPSDFSTIASPPFSLKLAAHFAEHYHLSFASASSHNLFVDSRAFLKTFPFLQLQLTALAHWLIVLQILRNSCNRKA